MPKECVSILCGVSHLAAQRHIVAMSPRLYSFRLSHHRRKSVKWRRRVNKKRRGREGRPRIIQILYVNVGALCGFFFLFGGNWKKQKKKVFFLFTVHTSSRVKVKVVGKISNLIIARHCHLSHPQRTKKKKNEQTYRNAGRHHRQVARRRCPCPLLPPSASPPRPVA